MGVNGIVDWGPFSLSLLILVTLLAHHEFRAFWSVDAPNASIMDGTEQYAAAVTYPMAVLFSHVSLLSISHFEGRAQ